MKPEPVVVPGWPRPSGYSNGVLAPAGARILFVAGQIGWDEKQQIVSADFVAQFRKALENVVAVVRAAGGEPSDVVRLTVFVTDKRAYAKRLKEVGECYRSVMGKVFPAMSLVQVAELLEEGALVEIEATAALAAESNRR
ncbi:MAG: RidA family protein [Planctomycetes bacterium]|nr:RidA family protein [Planctomycetota bacterium]